MSLDFWVDSSTTAVYLMNRLPSSVLPDNKSPFKLLFHRTPEYTSFRVFGCRCFPYLHVHASHKFSDKSLPCVFLLGTLLTSMAANVIIHQQDECIPADMFSLMKEYFHSRIQPYCHLLESDPYITNSLDRISSASHTFQVSQPLIPTTLCPQLGLSPPASLEAQENTTHSSAPMPSDSMQNEMDIKKSIEPDQPTTLCCKSSHPMTTQFKCGIIKPNPKHELSVSTNFLSGPIIVSEALAHPEWLAAMKEELATLEQNQTWTVVPKSTDYNVVCAKWVYKIQV